MVGVSKKNMKNQDKSSIFDRIRLVLLILVLSQSLNHDDHIVNENDWLGFRAKRIDKTKRVGLKFALDCETIF